MDKIALFYIGDKFYSKPRTFMGPIYRVDTYERYDWGFVSRDLSEGKEIHIRPATEEEMAWARQKLGEVVLRRS